MQGDPPLKYTRDMHTGQLRRITPRLYRRGRAAWRKNIYYPDQQRWKKLSGPDHKHP